MPYRARLNRLAGHLEPGTAMLLLSNQQLYRNADVEHKFRQDSSFWYLSGLQQADSALLLLCSAQGEISEHIFAPSPDPRRDLWTGSTISPQTAAEMLGIAHAHSFDQVTQVLSQTLKKYNTSKLYFDFGRMEYAELRQQICQIARQQGIQHLISTDVLLAPMRATKTPAELEHMRYAAKINIEAHQLARAAASSGMYEYQVQSIVEAHYMANGLDLSYPSIVATGRNATVLHYTRNDSRLHSGDLLLIDAGCECHGLASDITRTFAVGDSPSTVQSDVLSIVAAMHAACLRACTEADITFDRLHQVAVTVCAEGLSQLGVYGSGVTVDQILSDKLYTKYFPHRIGHWLGMDVHDLGAARSAVMPVGSVFTVEPGLYFGGDAPEHLAGIGVRLEDNIHRNSSTSIENLTAALSLL